MGMMYKTLLLLLLAHTALYAQEELTGSMFYNDGSPGRVSDMDMALRGKPGMKMYRATANPPYRVEKTITQQDVEYSLKQLAPDGTVTRDSEGNIIIVISATHRRIITPKGDITEVFESPAEFRDFYIKYTGMYPRLVKATAANGDKKPYLTFPLQNEALKRIYMRVIPCEDICIIETANFPVPNSIYREVRATHQFIQEYPNATYLENVNDRDLFLPLAALNSPPTGYFAFLQQVKSSSFNNTVDVYTEGMREITSGQSISEIHAVEKAKLMEDDSLLTLELIVEKDNGAEHISELYDKEQE